MHERNAASSTDTVRTITTLSRRLKASALGLVLAAAVLPIAHATSQALPPSPERRPFDAVVAIIGDRVILRTTLEREVDARARGRALNKEQRYELQQRIVMGWARNEVWVQHGKSIGEKAPAAFDQTIEKMVDETLEKRRRESGSFTSLNEELGLLGTSWDDVRRQQKSDILRQYAYGDVLTNLRRNSGLMVRPQEMRAFYTDNPQFFHQEESANLDRVSFDASKDPETALKNAEAARAAWAKESLTSEEVASRFGGTSLSTLQNLRQDASDERASYLKAFAKAAARGDVSEPLRRGRVIVLLHCQAKTEAKSRPFHEPEVQAMIRGRLAGKRSDAWSEQVMLRKQQKIYLWPPSLNLAR